MANATLKNINKKEDNKTEVTPISNAVPNIHYENKPELIWENMQMIAFNNKLFLKLA